MIRAALMIVVYEN